jgi:uncharacterized protein DUF4430
MPFARRHWPRLGRRRRGSPESEDLPLVATVPLEEGGNVRPRALVPLGAVIAALILAAPAFALRVHVRVEGAKATIFGPTEPRVRVVTGTITPPDGPAVTVSGATPFGALERASQLGEFYYRVQTTGFGPYVDRIGRLAGSASSGWVYKVNGVSPPVGADQYQLKDGDRVLWYYAAFGPTGGPRTLGLNWARRGGRRCVSAFATDDNGVRQPVEDVVFRVDRRRIESRRSQICPRGHWHVVGAMKQGYVRSQVLVAPRRVGLR